MADLTALIERLEKADGPDRELDAAIAAAIEPHRFDAPGFTPIRPIPPFRYSRSEGAIRFYDGGIIDIQYFPAVTGSIDAAVALATRLLPGVELEITNLYNVARVTLHHETGPFYGSSEINSIPIAICLSVLRALSTQEGSK